MKFYLNLLIIFLLVIACSSSKNWRGTSNLKGTWAEFEKLNGKQAFTILVPDNDTYLKYHFSINGGKLKTIIKSPNKTILDKEFREMDETDSIHLVNQKGTQYKIYLRGKQSSGEFNVKFTTSLD